MTKTILTIRTHKINYNVVLSNIDSMSSVLFIA